LLSLRLAGFPNDKPIKSSELPVFINHRDAEKLLAISRRLSATCHSLSPFGRYSAGTGLPPFGVRRQPDTPVVGVISGDWLIAPDSRSRHGPDAALDWDQPKTKAPSPRYMGNATPPAPGKHRGSHTHGLVPIRGSALPAHSKRVGSIARRPQLTSMPTVCFSRDYHSGALLRLVGETRQARINPTRKHDLSGPVCLVQTDNPITSFHPQITQISADEKQTDTDALNYR